MVYRDQGLDYKVCLKLLKASHLTGFFRFCSSAHYKIQTPDQRASKKYLKSPSKIEASRYTVVQHHYQPTAEPKWRPIRGTADDDLPHYQWKT